MLGLPLHRKFRELLCAMKRKRVDVNLEELDQRASIMPARPR